MKQYYYLICSLPFIRQEEAPPINSGEFRSLCREHVSASDLRLLDAAALIPAKGAAFPAASAFSCWLEREKILRRRLAAFRTERKSGNPGKTGGKSDEFADIDRCILDAYAKPDPALREKCFDSLRWHWLDELEFGHYFDVDKLLIYKLRLLLHEKWQGRNNERGYENFDRIVAAIVAGGHAAVKAAAGEL